MHLALVNIILVHTRILQFFDTTTYTRMSTIVDMKY